MMLDVSLDKKSLIDKLQNGEACIVHGEAGTGKTFAGILCGQKLLELQKPWQKILYLTYSKLAKWQIDKTRLMLQSKGVILSSQSQRMDIQNFHSLWWNLIRSHCSFLGLPSNLRICLPEELQLFSEECLNRLSSEERKVIIPSCFLTKNGTYDRRIGFYNKLNQALQGEAILYAQWGAENFGKRAKEFIGKNDFFIWAKNAIVQRNRNGLISHAEMIWWGYQLFFKHPTILNLLKAEYPTIIVDEFQDTDIAQWAMLKLLSSDTVIVMADIKQTIHGWRGASPKNRLEEFKKFSNEERKYNYFEHTLTEKHRAKKNMADNINIKRIYIKSDDLPREDKLRKRTLEKCKNLLKNYNGKIIGILCSSNLLADEVAYNLRRTQKNLEGVIYGYPINCSRLGSSNSPFDLVRTVVYELIECSKEPTRLQSYIANDLYWILLPFMKSNFPKCSRRSRNKEPLRRWKWSQILANNFLSNFGYALVLLKKYFIKQEKKHGILCDKNTLGCISYVGTNIQKIGKGWGKLNEDEQKIKVDSLVMQYENACASFMNEQHVSVMTVHQSKGREFDIVIIPWFNKSKWDAKDSFEWNTADTEIANIFYTACTRAKEDVFVISIKNLVAVWPPI